MSLTDIPVRALTSTRQQHVDDHNRYRNYVLQAVNSLDYGTLQAAIDDAATYKRPLIIAPGTYTLSASMLMNNLSDVHVFAYGAKFTISGDLASLLDMRDCTRCSWQGGWFNVPTGRTVANAIYVYRDTLQASRNSFQDVTVDGDYTVGVRIGQQSNGGQCDHMYITNLEVMGHDLAGQVGVYVGDGVYGNCLNHTFNDLMCSHNETHVKVDATNPYLRNAFFDTSVTDIVLNANVFSIRGGRSESATRFMSTGGPSGAVANVTIDDLEWHGEDIAADGEWIQHKLSGSLNLSNVRVLNAAHAPVVKITASKPVGVTVNGMTSTATAAEAISGAAAVTGIYTQHDDDGEVVSVTKL